MIRRIIQKFEDSKFFPAAAAAIWRTIIGASTSVESNLTLIYEHHGACLRLFLSR
jgi:hypothetical protein